MATATPEEKIMTEAQIITDIIGVLGLFVTAGVLLTGFYYKGL